MGWIIAGLVVAAILTGICVYAYYENNVWHPPFSLPDDLSKARNEAYNKRIRENTVTWVNVDGQTRSLCTLSLFVETEYVAFEGERCLICGRDHVIVERFTLDGFNHPRKACSGCICAFNQAANTEMQGGERVFPNYDIDDIERPYETWRRYFYILRQVEDDTLSDEEGRNQIATLLDSRSKTAIAARRAIAQASTAQAIAIQNAASQQQLQRLAERARHL